MKKSARTYYPISVVIPAYNEEEGIGACLASLTRQKTKFPFEVIVVDNNSTDKTAKIARSFRDKLNIHVITEKKQGRGAARYAGFEAAQGEVIFSTDADTILPPNWIDPFVRCFSDPEVVAVTSSFKIDDKIDNTILRVFNTPTIEMYNLFIGHYWLNGFSFAIRRDAYVSAGKLDASMNALDDFEISLRVKRIGKIKYMRNLYVTTSSRRYEKKGLIRGLFSYFRPCVAIQFGNRQIIMDDIR